MYIYVPSRWSEILRQIHSLEGVLFILLCRLTTSAANAEVVVVVDSYLNCKHRGGPDSGMISKIFVYANRTRIMIVSNYILGK